MTLVIGYNFRIPVQETMYFDLIEGKTDILTIPYTKDDIFKGDFLTLYPETDSLLQKDFEIIGHVNTIEDENGNPIKKVMRVMPLIETQRNGELESLNQSSKACYLKIKYLEDMLKEIDKKIDYLDNDLHYTDIQIMDKQKNIDYSVLCIYETQQKIDMQMLMNAPTVFDKYKVNLEDMVTLQERKNSFNHQLNQERLEFENLRKEAKEKSNELDQYRNLKQYVENQLSSNKTAICEYQHIKKSRNTQKPL